jgi:IS1 family transposase
VRREHQYGHQAAGGRGDGLRDLYLNETLRNLPCKRIQCDELWSFCYAKERNVPEEKRDEFGYGDVWTWVGIDADTKLVVSFYVGERDSFSATDFIRDLSGRLANRVQLTTDGNRPYLAAIDGTFGSEIDYAMLVKLYGNPKGNKEERRYSPGECCGTIKGAVCGNPDQKHISTSFIERQNLTVRMGMRRFTRLTNGFSKKIENHIHALGLHYMHYNFGRIHKTLRVTPAMQAGIEDHIWTLEEIANLAN